MDFRIFTDMSSDLTAQELLELGVVSVPIGLNIGDMVYPSANGYMPDVDEFYKLQEKHKITGTAGLGIVPLMEALGKVLGDGRDILFLAIDPDLSSASWNALNKARELLQEKYPHRRIETPNTHSIAPGLGLLVDYMVGFCGEDTTLDEALAELDRVSRLTAHWFTVDEYDTLRRGGRVSTFAAGVGALFSIKPFMRLPYEGSLEAIGKVRGNNAILKRLAEKVRDTIIDEAGKVWVSYGANTEKRRAEELAAMIRELLPFAEISFHRIGPIIGAHTGPTVLAVFFFATER